MVVRTTLTNEQGRISLSPEDLDGDLIQPGHRLFGLVWVNPQRMHREPSFSGSRVPVKTLLEHIEGGDPIEVFLDHFPPIPRAQVIAVLEASREALIATTGASEDP